MTDDWALVVHRDPDLLAMARGVVAEALQLPAERVIYKDNVADAKVALQNRGEKHCRLVVTSLAAPKSRRHSPSLDGSDLTGLRLARDLRDKGFAEPAVVFLVAFNDLERLAQEVAVPNVTTVEIGSDFHKRLPAAVAGVVRQGAARRRGVPCVNVDIFLQGPPPFRWQLKVPEPGSPCEDGGMLNIREEELAELCRLSRQERPGPQHLGMVGAELYRLFMADEFRNGGLNTSLRAECRRLWSNELEFSDIELARIRFVVDAATHGILLETLARPKPDASGVDFWMLKAPLFRKYAQRAEQFPLFKDRRSRSEPLDCLLIQARTSSFEAAFPVSQALEEIPLAAAEASDTENMLADLQRSHPALRIGEVRVLRYPEDAAGGAQRRSFAREVEEAIKAGSADGRPWKLIHYAGHSAQAENGRGYLVFGAEPEDAVDAEDFAHWSRRAQFVYLSSCRSAGAYFVMQMVERTIPAVLGYRWPVRDEVARFFAQRFYRHLFHDQVGQRFLEYAFLKARKDLYVAGPGVPDWASPVLVMQMIDPERDD
jgi:hypothetical protein